ncbi:MAG: DISARM system helicase DrmA [Actinobacteria bacterium]|nr:DISARM system helicase DrmA [Actinomycetota bacterium]
MTVEIGKHTDTTSQVPNAWLVRLGSDVSMDMFSVEFKGDLSRLFDVREGDVFFFAEDRSGHQHAIAFARVFRKRLTLETTTVCFDGFVSAEPRYTLDELGIAEKSAVVSRLDWPVFEDILKKVAGHDYLSFPTLAGDTPREQTHIRELLQYAVTDDLLGPADGPEEEIIGMSVRDRYLVGKLAPISPAEDRLEGLEGRQSLDENIAGEDLAPFSGRHQPGEEFNSTEGAPDPEGDEVQEIGASKNQSIVPSSMGLTFCVDGTVENIEVRAGWGRYERIDSELIDEKREKPFKCWKRIPSGGTITISLEKSTIAPLAVDEDCPEVIVQGTVSTPLQNGDRLVTLFLVNTQITPSQSQDRAWVFQPEVVVRDPENRAIFQRRPVLNIDGSDSERESLEMIYRRQVEFAVGHGVSVHAKIAESDNERAVEIRTDVLPQHEVPITEPPGLAPEDRPAMRRMIDEGYFDMERLAEIGQTELVSALNVLIDDYRVWIDEQKDRIGKSVTGYDNTAYEAMARCEQILDRLIEGIAVLGSDDDALEAFRFANRAMASQRIHGIYALRKRRGESLDIESVNVRKNRSWRPFQLAFILLSIPALADPTHRDRTESLEAFADLLWFPTGGGKTEAYLGVAAFAMAIRRLQGNLGGLDASRGLAVIMRYTLRLLTLQQFQRATALICAMEVLRRSEPDKKWGIEPFTIGLWVGQRVTPNSTEEAHKAIQAVRDGQRKRPGSPAQLSTCPWCGCEIVEGRDIEVRLKDDIGRTLIYCGDKLGECDFSRSKSKDLGLPVLVVDDEIYRRPPSMLIATVDKFAMMAWRGQVRTLFGRATQECERHGLLWPDADCNGKHIKNIKKSLPATSVKQIIQIRPPDLIIQDEFHLISGPLGTMVGLYETAVDELSMWAIGEKIVRPKVIASTATVRKADEQVNSVFLRNVAVFPAHGLDVEDNFFSVQRSIATKPGRRYMGICAPGSSRPAVLIRVYVALLTAAQSLFDRFGSAADPYMTLIGYFNSLRELGGMKRLAEDDVQTRCYRVQMSKVARPGLAQRGSFLVDELTSRVSSKDIPGKLDQLEVRFKKDWEAGETKAVDVVLATNMLSVGVDVDRLGLMVMNGQPKNTAEYIQATSRIGRSYPGLVCTVLTWSRPRDLSHYETFEHYHATFYKHVEAQSVTPFAPRALDRGLTGTMVSLIRLIGDEFNPNLGAQELDSTSKPEIGEIKRVISDRAWKVTNKKPIKEIAEAMLADRVDRWAKEANKAGRKLGYAAKRGQGDIAPLLKKPGPVAWDEFTVPMSLREVEPDVKLIMDVAILPDPPSWRPRKTENKDGGEV